MPVIGENEFHHSSHVVYIPRLHPQPAGKNTPSRIFIPSTYASLSQSEAASLDPSEQSEGPKEGRIHSVDSGIQTPHHPISPYHTTPHPYPKPRPMQGLNETSRHRDAPPFPKCRREINRVAPYHAQRQHCTCRIIYFGGITRSQRRVLCFLHPWWGHHGAGMARRWCLFSPDATRLTFLGVFRCLRGLFFFNVAFFPRRNLGSWARWWL